MIRVLEEAADIVKRKWGSTGKGWKVALAIFAVFLVLAGIVWLVLQLLIWLVRGLTVGGYRNRDLYFPKMKKGRF